MVPHAYKKKRSFRHMSDSYFCSFYLDTFSYYNDIDGLSDDYNRDIVLYICLPQYQDFRYNNKINLYATVD
jgi:hypothetical protein